eukprot:6464738-Amphidinium_carterae.1
MEEFIIHAKEVLAPGSRALMVVDLDYLAGVQFSESEGSMSSKSYSIANHQLFDAAVSVFAQCRACFGADGTQIRPKVPRPSEGERWCLVITRSKYLLNMFRERIQWPKSARERLLEQQEEQEKMEVKCAHCQALYRECDNKDAPGSCSYHPSAPFHVHVDGSQIPEELHLKTAIQRQFEIAADEKRQKLERIVFGCCLQPVAPHGGCRQTKHRPPGSSPPPCEPCEWLQ